MDRFQRIAELGVTALALLPLADFSGRFGWSYDGVNLLAPSHVHGAPDDLCALVDHAHALGLGVVLDVVYSHFGPDRDWLPELTPKYVAGTTEWCGDHLRR